MSAKRLKRKGKKETFSISVSPATKLRLRQAARAHGGNVSALVEALVRELDRQSALDWLLAKAPAVEAAGYQGFLDELGSATRKARPARRLTPVTLDTGALIAIERRKPRGVMLLTAARERRVELLVPTVVHAEWWRGRTDVRDRIKVAVTLVPLPVAVAESAGVVLGHLDRRAGLVVDVMVMAFTAMVGGGVVYTSDVGDLQRIGARYPAVRVLGV